MSLLEETIDAILDSNGQLQLSHQPQLPPGHVQVTIRAFTLIPRRRLTDVLKELAAEQRARGFPGRTASEIEADEKALLGEDAERDQEFDSARHTKSAGGP